jgi:anti-anti-sigma factor
MPGQLTVVAGPDQGRTFPLEDGKPLVIGRGLNTEARLTDPRVSRVHCEVKLAGDRLHLTDAGSSTGTLVNDRRVVEEEIAPGTVFQVGSTRLRFDVGDAWETTTLVEGVPALGPIDDGAEPLYHHLQAHTEPSALVLALTGHQVLDEESAEALRVEMMTAVTRAGTRRVVVDFHKVKSVSTAIIRPLISLRRRLGAPGDRLVLCGLGALVEQVLRMSGMIGEADGKGTPYETAPDQAAALARLGPR